MVQLRVIKGGKTEGNCECSNVRLFSAYSLVDNYQGRDSVRFNWIYLEREAPVASYEQLIGDYKCIDERVRPYFEEYVKELFTEEEIEMLRSYLFESKGAVLQVNEEPVPAMSVFVPMPYQGMPPGSGRGFYYLSENKQCELPFRAAAYFDLRNCPASIALQHESKKSGCIFLQQALHQMGLSDHMSKEQLERAVEAIYDSHGLFVERGKTRDERMKERAPLGKGDCSPLLE